MDVSFSSVFPVIDHQFRQNIVKVVCESTRLSIHSYFDYVMTKFKINNRTDAWKTDVNILNTPQTSVSPTRLSNTQLSHQNRQHFPLDILFFCHLLSAILNTNILNYTCFLKILDSNLSSLHTHWYRGKPSCGRSLRLLRQLRNATKIDGITLNRHQERRVGRQNPLHQNADNDHLR